MFPLIYGLILLSCQGWLVLSSPVKYDQRQEGDVNVQIDLKDVKIIALLNSDVFDDYTNYDYAYDYADFTVKPVTKPTKPTKPPTTTTAATTAAIKTSSKLSETSTVLLTNSSSLETKTTESVFSSTSATSAVTDDNKIVENFTMSIESNADEMSLKKLKNEDKFKNLFEKIVNATEEAPSATTEALTEKQVLVHKQTKRCRAGYDKSGTCHRRRISLLPLAMKVAPQLIRSMRQQLIH
ncbi:uncharacterized protein LOC117178776 [Belonocnema kinseyi]|uniref:uncharacterized protein LOC117178776 n=1 Tax=Belonocnema kinseyi TaxID=2817044 RepID=UPI00143CD27E|nr:uncharacterized protein LOC117178776 [Belonocnema kinseyi]